MISDTGFRALIIHEDIEKATPFIQAFEARQSQVILIPDSEIPVWQPHFNGFDIILVSENISSIAPVDFILSLAGDPLTSLIPVMVMNAKKDNYDQRVYDLMIQGAAAVFPEDATCERIVSFIAATIEKIRSDRFDPVTGLLRGAPLYRIISDLCNNSEYDWHFLKVKLRGLQSYNLGYDYDEGDRLIASVGDVIRESLRENAPESAMLGRLGGSSFCVITRSKRIESLCRDIRVRAERAIRKFYSAFELMKGYLTIEDGTAAGDYYLCEVIIGVVSVPAGWDRNAAYLFDLVGEVVELVEREESDFRIVHG